jgi:hypothetical protein
MSFIIPRIHPIELELDGVRILFPRVDFQKRAGFARLISMVFQISDGARPW